MRRERLVVDFGATHSFAEVNGKLIRFHGHLFRQPDGKFHFSERDRTKFPPYMLTMLESCINEVLTYTNPPPTPRRYLGDRCS
jgi:hypothetical protein